MDDAAALLRRHDPDASRHHSGDGNPSLWKQVQQRFDRFLLRNRPIVHIELRPQPFRRFPIDQEVEVDVLVRVEDRDPENHRRQSERGDDHRKRGKSFAVALKKPRKPGAGQEAHRPIDEVQVAPTVVNVADPERNDDRHQRRRNQQRPEPANPACVFRMGATGQRARRIADQPPANHQATENGKRRHHGWRGNGEPHGNVRPRPIVSANYLAEKQ